MIEFLYYSLANLFKYLFFLIGLSGRDGIPLGEGFFVFPQRLRWFRLPWSKGLASSGWMWCSSPKGIGRC